MQKKEQKKRLTQIKSIGCFDFGDGSFGISNVVSVLYIEMVWNYDETNHPLLPRINEMIEQKT